MTSTDCVSLSTWSLHPSGAIISAVLGHTVLSGILAKFILLLALEISNPKGGV
jgi:hypothetical protein